MKLFFTILCSFFSLALITNQLPVCEARAYNPMIENWNHIRSGFQALLDDDVGSCIDLFTQTLSRAQDFDPEESLSMMAASAFGLYLCCDRLDRMDEVYKELGKLFASYLLYQDVFEDLVDETNLSEESIRIQLSTIIDRLWLTKSDFVKLKTSCKDKNLSKILESLQKIAS